MQGEQGNRGREKEGATSDLTLFWFLSPSNNASHGRAIMCLYVVYAKDQRTCLSSAPCWELVEATTWRRGRGRVREVGPVQGANIFFGRILDLLFYDLAPRFPTASS